MRLSLLPFPRLAAPLAPLLLASACAPVPQLGPQPLPRAPETLGSAQSLPATAIGSWPDDRWWQSLGDAQLDALIAEGLRNSPDVAAASARFRRASGAQQESRGATLPSLDVGGAVNVQKQSLNLGYPDEFKAFLPRGWNDFGQVDATLAYDLDLWGKNRAALAAATSETRAAAIDAAQAGLMLAAGIASAYVDLDRLYAERDVRQGELDVRTATQNLVSQRRANGLETRGSTRQADAEVANARNALSAADEQIALRQHQIAALIGAGPDRGLAVARPALAATVSRDLPEGVTTDLVGRRPDVAAARARVEAAASRIRVARADFYPAIRLTALFGVQALGLGQLFDGDSTYGRVGPAVSLPVFHGGAIQGRYRGARASYDEAVASYDQTVVAAYQQVADAVTSQRAAGERLVQARAARAAAQDAYDIARLRYEGGLSNYLDVLTVQDRLLQSRLAVAGLEASLRSLDIALVRALGGGFTAPPARTTDNSLKDPTHG
jgi:NodT family efflux transporter outer membrane factor (OMF) lipoprotein